MVDVPDWNGTITSKVILLRKITKHYTYQKKVTLETKKKMILRCIILLNKHTTTTKKSIDPPGRQKKERKNTQFYHQ